MKAFGLLVSLLICSCSFVSCDDDDDNGGSSVMNITGSTWKTRSRMFLTVWSILPVWDN
ncbi:hypothetical protein SFC43_09540 [Bacteroides sp. CR5/BHMF/2]|nr:hypothetical protein [Bacteroides sp. CR5/BHMF/2]